MKDLIKEIRMRLSCSQEQLAAELGVSPITVSRWENGRAKPSILAQKRLYEICAERKLDLADYLVNREKREESELALYHASRKGIVGSIQPVSRSKCDFGRGFYMGTDPLQPLTLVCNEDAPRFYRVSIDWKDLNVLDIEVGIDWAMLIAFCRGYMVGAQGSPIYEKYAHMTDGVDVIIGYIADDRMYQVLTDFFEERITDTALLGSLSALNLGKQYVAISQRACDQITVHNERTLSKLELMILKEKSIVRRREGIRLADRIVREHRRDGRYFDEILRGEFV